MSHTLKCISPVNGEVYAKRPAASAAEAEAAVDRAKAAHSDWSRRPLDERVRLVLAGVERVGAMNDEIVPELAWQMGRPVRFGGEFSGFKERAEYMASIADKALADVFPDSGNGFRRRISREPFPTVFVIAPWNYPYMTAINTVAPALIAGSSVVLKHATQTMLVGERMETAFREAGLPDDVFQNLFLDHSTALDLISSGSFGFVNFTGSVETGRVIKKAAAGTFTSLGLELGGKDPGYVAEDADVGAAAEGLMDGATFNSGQCCCGIERIYVHASRFDDFVGRAVEFAQNLKLGDPLKESTNLGPMAQKRFATEVRDQIKEAVDSGAVAHVERFDSDDGDAYLSPQVLTSVDHGMRLMQDENFGPVAGIMSVESDEEAAALMNDSRFGLTASIWTSDSQRAERLGSQLDTGTVFMNRCDYLDPSLCWTGRKDTGRGAALSQLGYQALTRPKSYHLKIS